MLFPVVAPHPGMKSLLLKTQCTSDKGTRGPGNGSDLKVPFLRTLFYGLMLSCKLPKVESNQETYEAVTPINYDKY